MNLLKTIRVARSRRHWCPPRGTTHVLQWFPASLLDDPVLRDGPGWWEIQPLAAFLSGQPADGCPYEDGPADRPEADSWRFADAVFGENTVTTPFEVEIAIDGREFACPAFWLTPPGRSR